MFDNNFQDELQKIFFRDFNITFKEMIIIAFSFEGFLFNFLNYFSLIFQIYFFSDFEKFSLYLYIFILCLIIFKFLSLITIYFKKQINHKVNILFTNKKIYEMGDFFKIGILILELINILYFLLKVIFFPLISNFLISNILKEEFIEISHQKIESFINLNFITLILKTINEMFLDILILFRGSLIINSNNICKNLFKILFCKIYISKYKEWYFIKGICYSNIYSEVFSLIFLLIFQHFKNFYPQTWSKFSLKLFINVHYIYSIFKELIDIKEFIIIIIISYYDYFFVILFILSYIKDNNYNKLFFFFSMILFKKLFFGMKGKEKIELMKIYKNLKIGDQDDDEYEFSNYDYDTKIRVNKNYEYLQFVKSKLIGNIILQIIFFICFLLFYLFNGFNIINIQQSNFIIIIIFGIHSIIEFTSKIIINLYSICFTNQKIFFFTSIGFIFSIILFYLNYFLFKNFLLMILFIYSTYYIILIKFYREIQIIDLDYITINDLSSDDKIEILDYN